MANSPDQVNQFNGLLVVSTEASGNFFDQNVPPSQIIQGTGIVLTEDEQDALIHCRDTNPGDRPGFFGCMDEYINGQIKKSAP